MPKGPPATRRSSQRAQRAPSTSDPPRRARGALRGRSTSTTTREANSSSSAALPCPSAAAAAEPAPDNQLLHAPSAPCDASNSTGIIALNREQLEQLVGGMVQAAITAAVPHVDALGQSTPQQQSTVTSLDVQAPLTAPEEQGFGVPHDSGMERMDVACGVVPDLSFHVSASTRQNIVNHRFVDLSSLLDTNNQHPQSSEGTFTLVDGRLRPARSPRTITTFSAWTMAFLRYAGIYLQAHPGDALGLVNHMRQVSSLTAPGLGLSWREFDEHFRRARELIPAVYRWGASDANSPIWLNAIARGIASASTGLVPGASGARKFQPVCLSFNRPGGCTRSRCRYLHSCRICRGTHSALRCPQRPVVRTQRAFVRPAAPPAPRK